MQEFKELVIWQRSHRLVLRIYGATRDLPKEETFGLVLNLRRSAVAVATRISEGCGKGSNDEFAVELRKARAIGYELEYLLLLSRDLGLLEANKHDELAGEVIEVRKMTSGLLKRLMACP